MLEAVAIVALVLSAISFGLSLGNSSKIDNHKAWHNTHKILRSSIDSCTQSQIRNITDWLKDIDSRIKTQEEECQAK